MAENNQIDNSSMFPQIMGYNDPELYHIVKHAKEPGRVTPGAS